MKVKEAINFIGVFHVLRKQRINRSKINLFRKKKVTRKELPWRRRKQRDVKTLSLKKPKQRMAIPGVIPWGFHAMSNKLLSRYSECLKLPANRFKRNARKCVRFTTCSLLTKYLSVLIHLRAQLQPQNARTNQPTVESLLAQCPRTSSESVVVLPGIDFVSSTLNKQNAFYGADVILRY